MQGQDNLSRQVPGLEHIGFELEHQQQDYPGCRIDGGCVCLDDVGDCEPVCEAVRGGSPFFDKEQVNIQGQECVDRIFK